MEESYKSQVQTYLGRDLIGPRALTTLTTLTDLTDLTDLPGGLRIWITNVTYDTSLMTTRHKHSNTYHFAYDRSP